MVNTNKECIHPILIEIQCLFKDHQILFDLTKPNFNFIATTWFLQHIMIVNCLVFLRFLILDQHQSLLF